MMQTREVPTGHILTVQGEHGLLECLSIGDYGKEANLKADFLGLQKEVNSVPDGTPLLPLEKKWVITISSQYGCSMGCTFCDVPKVGPGKNATFRDLMRQVCFATNLHAEVKHTERLNLHYARMGEPSFNWEVINSAMVLAGQFDAMGWGFHPVVSTMMPATHMAMKDWLAAWMHVKNVIMDGNAGLQISVNTTDEEQRAQMFNHNAMTLRQISYHLNHFEVKGRKIALNIALTKAPVDAQFLASLFDTDKFLVKITPMHLTASCKENDLFTGGIEDGYGYTAYQPYQQTEEELKKAGFDVIVFIPSKEEDESRITCGNAILADRQTPN